MLAALGTTTSLVSSLNTSANGCSRPLKPTRVGPRRTCIAPIILRSQYVRYATHRMMGTAITTILTSDQTTIHATGPSSA
ncbi:Uncharacterised protein [Bordetella pertussis]|nr:Uncharacterised protein [Bordetella pertussis]